MKSNELINFCLAVLMLVFFTTSTSCRTTKIQERSSKTDSSWVTQKPIEITVTGGKTESVNIDSILRVFLELQKAGKQGNTLLIKDTSGKALLRFWVDEAGRIRADCEAKDQQFTAMVNEFHRVIKEERDYQKTKFVIPGWVWIAIVVLAIPFLIMVVFMVVLSIKLYKRQ